MGRRKKNKRNNKKNSNFEDKVQFDAGNNLSTTEVNTPYEQSPGESSKPQKIENSSSEIGGSNEPKSNQNLRQKMLDEVKSVNKTGHEHITDPKFIMSRKSDPGKIMQDEDMVTRKRFSRARTYYGQNLKKAEIIESHINKAKESFLKNDKYDKSMISDDNIVKIREAFGEAKNEYNKTVLDHKRIGTNTPRFDEKAVNAHVAQKVFGQAGDVEMAAVEYGRLKMTGDELIAKYQNRNNILGKYIDSAQEKGENKIARGAKASVKGGLGWKGKAAIFGGVALGALSLVGVANMAMSGGRQSNSNLYNPYQAMY